MQSDRNAKEDPNEHHRPTANCKQREAAKNQWHKIESVHKHMNGILGQVGRVTLDYALFVLLRRATQNPSHVCPPASVARRMGVAHLIGVLMVNAMSHNPVD